MIPDDLKEAESDFKRAVERRDYPGLERSAAVLRKMVDVQLAGLPAGHPVRREIASWGVVLMEWAKRMTSIQRQKYSDETQFLSTLSRYLDRPARSAGSVCVDL